MAVIDNGQVILDVCTPEGKTWLARIVGVGGRFGLDRDFVPAVSRNLSRSGMTGSMTYAIPMDGIYEANEGRRRLGKTWYRVEGDKIEEIDESAAIAAVKAAAGG